MFTEEELAVFEEELILDYADVPAKTQREALHEKYEHQLQVNKSLDRSLISFQANKSEPLYRWFKYKEGFSAAFVSYILKQFAKPDSVILDPFAGIGTTITTSIQHGFNAIGIELLSSAILATNARIASKKIKSKTLENIIAELEDLDFFDKNVKKDYFFKHLNITRGAFPPETELAIANIRQYIEKRCEDVTLKALLKFAVSSILEDVSFTRKDGQYLRWDYRSSRNLKSKFDKGRIYEFRQRLLDKLQIISEDLESVAHNDYKGSYNIIKGSCLERLHDIEDESVDLIITSPPYCNRYDYTRTYALELAFEGMTDQQIKELRQTLLSATVENKNKYVQLKTLYQKLDKIDVFEKVVETYREQPALKEVLRSLNFHKDVLNNKNIPSMVRNYFFEMNFVINEMGRVLRPGGKVVMVNDNVRYNGDEIPVDLILSELAGEAGLKTDVIWVLERGKGNSSQQMGAHGRKEMRKCVYVWSKEKN